MIINLNGGTAASIGLWTESEQLQYYSALGISSVTLASMSAAIVTVNAGQSAGGTHTSPFLRGWYTGEDNLQLPSSSIIENVIGGAGNDIITGHHDVKSTIKGGPGNDTLNGGINTLLHNVAIFSGSINNYTITGINGAQITDNVGTDGTDVTENFTRFHFPDAV